MDDNRNTKEQRIQESENLRRRIAELDIAETERKRVEEKLRDSEQHLDSILNSITEAVFTISPDFKILWANKAALGQAGKKLEEVIGQDCFFVSHHNMEPCSSENETCPLKEAIRTGAPAEAIHKHFNSLGNEIFVELVLYPLKDKKGRITQYVHVSHDVTEIKKAEELLLKSKRKYQELADSISDVFFAMDKNLRYIYWNKASELLTGVPAEKALGKTLIEVFPDNSSRQHVKEMYLQVMETNQPQNLIVNYPGDEGIVHEISAYPIVEGVSVFVKDITERKRAEDERIIMSKLESTGVLAGGIAHDYNNLLSVILGNLELIRMFPQDGMMNNYLEEAEKAASTARVLTRQLIDFAKGGEPIKKRVSLSGLLEDQVTFALRGSSVGCNFFMPADLWLTEVDESQMNQVIRNIAINAREAMPEGGMVAVKAENLVLNSAADLSLPLGDYVKVSITDQGKGIPEEILPKIFDPYFSTKQRGDQKGMGLGLTISHSAIQKHGGAITVDSKASKGTTIQIYLPALRKRLEEETAVPAVPTGRSRILVMEDEELMRHLLGVMISRLGYEVELVEEGKKAVACYRLAKDRGQPFDALILDLTVQGGMGGVKTIRELMQFDPTVKAIVLSGYDKDPVLQNFEQYGFKGVLTKPFTVNELSEILPRVIGTDRIPKVK